MMYDYKRESFKLKPSINTLPKFIKEFEKQHDIKLRLTNRYYLKLVKLGMRLIGGMTLTLYGESSKDDMLHAGGLELNKNMFIPEKKYKLLLKNYIYLRDLQRSEKT